MNLINPSYENKKEKDLTKLFLFDKSIKKYILGINKFTKCISKHIEVDGVIDDFTRVQKSKKKSILDIKDIEKDSLILFTSSGSPLEVKNYLDKNDFLNLSYFAFYKYSKKFGLYDFIAPDFMSDFEDDFSKNFKEYEKTYNLLNDTNSKNTFEKLINFKISHDFSFMQGFTNNFEEQYFDKELIKNIDEVVFLDGGAYVGDTIPNIEKNFPNYKKIFCFEPNSLHLKIAKNKYEQNEKITFVNCGLGSEKKVFKEENSNLHHGSHDYQALNINAIDNLISQKIDFIKLDIEGAEQDAIKGSKKTIKKYHPLLAICIYHKASDWYMIPRLVLDIREDYDIYIRHYMESNYETVMYFLPRK